MLVYNLFIAVLFAAIFAFLPAAIIDAALPSDYVANLIVPVVAFLLGFCCFLAFFLIRIFPSTRARAKARIEGVARFLPEPVSRAAVASIEGVGRGALILSGIVVAGGLALKYIFFTAVIVAVVGALLYLGFQAITALPLSVAVIVGALIIASAIIASAVRD